MLNGPTKGTMAVVRMLCTQFVVCGVILAAATLAGSAPYYPASRLLPLTAARAAAGGIGIALVLTVGQALTTAVRGRRSLAALLSTHEAAVTDAGPDERVEAALRHTAGVNSVEASDAGAWVIRFDGAVRGRALRATARRDHDRVVITVTRRWPYLAPDFGTGQAIAAALAGSLGESLAG